jgi:hypothetical protein
VEELCRIEIGCFKILDAANELKLNKIKDENEFWGATGKKNNKFTGIQFFSENNFTSKSNTIDI